MNSFLRGIGLERQTNHDAAPPNANPTPLHLVSHRSTQMVQPPRPRPSLRAHGSPSTVYSSFTRYAQRSNHDVVDVHSTCAIPQPRRGQRPRRAHHCPNHALGDVLSTGTIAPTTPSSKSTTQASHYKVSLVDTFCKKNLDAKACCVDSAITMAATAASERTLRELATTIGALTAAIDMDVDRSDDDRLFFTNERSLVQASFNKLFDTDQAVTKHVLLVKMPRQATVIMGDNVLDRGVRAGKSRMRLELKNSTMPGGEDHVFPADISEITDAERRVEPHLVLTALGKFDQVPDFAGKADVKADMEGRATRQQGAFQQRDAGEATADTLDGALDRAVSDSDELLFVCEKHLAARFPRDARYVASFFIEKPSRKKTKAPEPPIEPDPSVPPTGV